MYQRFAGIAILLLSNVFMIAQEPNRVQGPTLGIHFVFNDFENARNFRSAKLKDMSQGLALSYSKGLTRHFDFVSTLSGAFLNYPIPGKEDLGGQFLMLEGDASLRGKMFSVGVSKYQGYWGTFIPAGAGIQINFFNEAYLMINSQYRIPVTETANYHFIHSIGLVGNIGSKD